MMYRGNQWIFFFVTVMSMVPVGYPRQTNKKEPCYRSLTEEDVSQLKIRASAFIRQNPFFTKHVLKSFPYHYFNPPIVPSKPYIPTTLHCDNGYSRRVLETGNDSSFKSQPPILTRVIPGNCDAIFISEDWVVMSAHCANARSNLLFRFMSDSFRSTSMNFPIIHSDYSNGLKYDVALIQLKKPHTPKEGLPACAPSIWSDITAVGISCAVVKMHLEEGNKLVQTRYANVTVVKYNTKLIYVTGRKQTGERLKQVGGVLFCWVNGHFTAVGLAAGTCRHKTKGRLIPFTRLSYYLGWIEAKVTKENLPFVQDNSLITIDDEKLECDESD